MAGETVVTGGAVVAGGVLPVTSSMGDTGSDLLRRSQPFVFQAFPTKRKAAAMSAIMHAAVMV